MKKFFRNRKGFSLVELLCTMGIMGFVLSAIFALAISADRNRANQDLILKMQQDSRSGLEFTARELRAMVTLSCMQNTTTPCATTGDMITFTSVNDTDTRIFSWNSNDAILRFSKSSGTPDRQPLVENITSVTLTPYDANNNVTTSLAKVKRIDISIIGRTSAVDPNTKSYHTYPMRTSVRKRN